MKITKIIVWQLDLPLKKPYWLSGGRLKFERLDSTFLRIDTDAGLSGWGEGCPWGNTYLPAHGAGLRAALGLLGPALIGCDPRSLDHINRVMDNNLPGHLYAKSPLDMACWDILGKSSEMPLWKLFGGTKATPVHVNSSISTGSPEEMIDLVLEARAKGYRTHSAKLGGNDIATDIERINKITEALEPREQVTFDINRAWTPSTALQVMNSVKSNAWVEQPCETMEECALVAGSISQPVLLDECLHTFQDHLNAWKTSACVGIKVKPNRLGGLTKARKVRDFALSVGWRMHIEDVGGSAFADTVALHLAASTPESHRMDSWLCHDHLAVDPVPGQGVRNENGKVMLPDHPGIGIEPDPALLGEPIAVYRN